MAVQSMQQVRDDCSSDVMKRSSPKKLIDLKNKSRHVLSLIMEDRTLNFEVQEVRRVELCSYMKRRIVSFSFLCAHITLLRNN